jgi:DNA primase
VARIAKESIEQVVASADMLDVVGQYTQLKKAGANYSGRCPFHEEKTPSFSVDPVEKLYYCFGCGEGGDLLSFVQKKENLDFAQAVEQLADRYGVTLKYDESGPGDAGRKRRERLRKLLEQACAYYERVLWEARAAEAARAYLAARGLGEEVCHRFRLGYSLPGWSHLRDAAGKKGFTEKELLEAGLVVPGKRGSAYDRFRGRLMFPLADERGRVLGFGARTLTDETPKYLNSPETPLYHKSEALFGLDKAKASAVKDEALFVVEGYTDVLALVQAGVANVVASMGTAFTEDQLGRIARVTRNLYLCFDADAAGLGAMQRALELGRRAGVCLRVVMVPDGLDPADWVHAGHDGDAFRALAAEAQTLLQFQVRTVLSSHDLATVDGRMRALSALRGIIAQASSPIERDEEVRYVADRLQLSEENVRFLLSGKAEARQARRVVSDTPRTAASGGARPRPTPEQRVLMGTHELEVRFLAACLAVPDKGLEYLSAIDDGFLAGHGSRQAYAAVRARLEARSAGKTAGSDEAEEARGDDPGLMAEVIVRAAAERFTEQVLKELFLRVQEAHAGRLIGRLSIALQQPGSGEDEAKLLELEAMRRQIRDEIRAIPVEE